MIEILNYLKIFVAVAISLLLIGILKKSYSILKDFWKKLVKKIKDNYNNIFHFFNIVTVIYIIIAYFWKIGLENVIKGIINTIIKDSTIIPYIIKYINYSLEFVRIIVIIYLVVWIIKTIISAFCYCVQKIKQRNDYKNNVEKTNDLYKSLYEYLLDKNNMPILITGSWGIGKTYTLDNFFENYYKYKGKKIYKVSCFGITTKEQLLSSIKDVCKKNDNSIFSQLIDLIGKLPIIGEFLKKLLEKKYDFNSLKKGSIFVFDNFERTIPYYYTRSISSTQSKEITNLLEVLPKYNVITGVIDELKEIYGMKVIIVANEFEMPRDYIYDNFICKLGCKKFKIELQKNIFKELWDNSINQISESQKYLNEFEKIFNEVKENAWEIFKLSKCENIRILGKCIYNYIEFILYIYENNELDEINNEKLGIFYTNLIINLMGYENELSKFYNITEGQNIACYSDANNNEEKYENIAKCLTTINAMWYSNDQINELWENMEGNFYKIAMEIERIQLEENSKYLTKFNFNRDIKELDEVYFEDIAYVLHQKEKEFTENAIEILKKVKINFNPRNIIVKTSNKYEEIMYDVANLIKKYDLELIFIDNSELLIALFDCIEKNCKCDLEQIMTSNYFKDAIIMNLYKIYKTKINK